jgi:hypothetical protein
LDLPIGKWANGIVSFRSRAEVVPTASSVERGGYERRGARFWVAYAKMDIEAHKRTFVHVRLKDMSTEGDSGKSGIVVALVGVNEGVYSTTGPLIVLGQGGKDVVKEGVGLRNPLYLLESTTSDNFETDLDNEATQWAGLTPAVEILNA